MLPASLAREAAIPGGRVEKSGDIGGGLTVSGGTCPARLAGGGMPPPRAAGGTGAATGGLDRPGCVAGWEAGVVVVCFGRTAPPPPVFFSRPATSVCWPGTAWTAGPVCSGFAGSPGAAGLVPFAADIAGTAAGIGNDGGGGIGTALAEPAGGFAIAGDSTTGVGIGGTTGTPGCVAPSACAPFAESEALAATGGIVFGACGGVAAPARIC